MRALVSFTRKQGKVWRNATGQLIPSMILLLFSCLFETATIPCTLRLARTTVQISCISHITINRMYDSEIPQVSHHVLLIVTNISLVCVCRSLQLKVISFLSNRPSLYFSSYIFRRFTASNNPWPCETPPNYSYPSVPSTTFFFHHLSPCLLPPIS